MSCPGDHAARPALNAAVHCLGGDIAADALEALLVRRTIAAPSTRGRSQSFYVKERDAEKLAFAAADAPAWKAAVAAELDYVDPKAKMRATIEDTWAAQG